MSFLFFQILLLIQFFIPITILRPSRLIMPNSEIPQQIAGNQEKTAKDWQQHIPLLICSSNQIKKRIILKQSIRNQIGAKTKNSFSIDVDRILSIFSCTIRQHIHKFQAFDCKKADTCIDQKQAAKYYASTHNHQHQSDYFSNVPLYF